MRHKLPALFFILAIAFLGAAPLKAQDKKLKTEIKLAKQLLEYEEYANAIPHLETLLKHDPQNAAYNFWMGKCQFLTYHKNTALHFFKQVEAVNPNVDEEFHYYYGLTLHYNDEYDKAIEEYRLDQERFSPDRPEYIAVNNRISQCLYAKRAADVPDNGLVIIDNMGDAINTAYAEHSPVISADNQVLIYTARRPDSRGADIASAFYDEDIYVSKNEGGVWSPAENIGLPVNSKGHDATISLTADGETLYLYRHKKDGGLYRTDFDAEAKRWREPMAIQKPLNSKYYEASICQSADSSLIFFTSDRPGGYGGLDIYMAQREGKNDWTEPRNLGPGINTAANEDAPFFHPDGRTLYYSSDGPNGYGGYDIFVTEYDSASGTFLQTLNMGKPVNSADDEIYFVLSADGLHGYYTSGKEGGKGEKDIYEIRFPHASYPRRRYGVEVVGIVQDAQTLDTLHGTIRLVDGSSGSAIDSVATVTRMGQYHFQLEPQRAYSLEVWVDGYGTASESFTTPKLVAEDVKLEKNLILARMDETIVKAETPVAKENPSLEHLYFDFDKADLRSASEQELEIALGFLKQNQDLRIEITGHTDWYNDYAYNVDLSERRTRAASDYLRSQGVPANRIIEKWMSEIKPIESNEDDRGRQFNRRCELRFIDDAGKLAFASVPLRPGSEGPEVDHATPKGQPGFDYVSAFTDQKPSNSGSVSIYTASLEETTILDELVRDAEPSPMPAVADLGLHHIYFGFDKTALSPEASTDLQKAAQALLENPSYRLVLKGHADAIGDWAYNQSLSEQRCAAAREGLLALGVASDRIAVEGLSESAPIDRNDVAQGRQSNRRVEFELYDGDRLLSRSTH